MRQLTSCAAKNTETGYQKPSIYYFRYTAADIQGTDRGIFSAFTDCMLFTGFVAAFYVFYAVVNVLFMMQD